MMNGLLKNKLQSEKTKVNLKISHKLIYKMNNHCQ